jgi:energy-coupling factor transporter ATP-binding protein EcfA2
MDACKPMSLEEQIVDWAASRPLWQQAVLRRVATGGVFSDTDYDELVNALVMGKELEGEKFGLKHLPQSAAGDPPVRIVSIEHPEHVNALESEKPLTFEAAGLTIIYGDNGSGKSGYARLLKRITRARHQEDVLTDVFRDTALVKPKATLNVRNGSKDVIVDWPDSNPPELKRMLFYDQACGGAYVDTESDFPYRPSALFVMDGLIDVCVAIRERIDGKLAENAGQATNPPVFDEDLIATKIGEYLSKLSSSSSASMLDQVLKEQDFSDAAIGKLQAEEARLGTADTSSERQKLQRRATKLEEIRNHMNGLGDLLGNEAAASLAQERSEIVTLRKLAGSLADSYKSEPLSGVGTKSWKELWEAARRYSEAEAYAGRPFPVVDEGCKCLLCQQDLTDSGRNRLSRFEQFFQDDTQKRLREAEKNWQARLTGLAGLETSPIAIDAHLKDFETDAASLVGEVKAALKAYENQRVALIASLKEPGAELPKMESDKLVVNSKLQASAKAATEAATTLSDPAAVKARLAELRRKKKELELLRSVQAQRANIDQEVERLKQRDVLEGVKNAAATGTITKKVLELSEANITEVVRDTFTRETDRLNLERVTISKTRAEKGALLHLPKLVGARQNVTLRRVFSEGERTALGLAAFFAEAQLDASKSGIILDDPVTSLDHIRRGLVATRLAALAEARQVIVFTHDVSFVADLKREAKGVGVALAERSVTRGRGGEKKPGNCGAAHPWKAKDVTERLGYLRTELARLKKGAESWDETAYEVEVATWAGNLSETWERIFSQEVVGQILAEGGLEVRPNMVKILSRFTEDDEREFQASYSRVSQWAKRHDKSTMTNYVAPDLTALEQELVNVDGWFKRVKAYKV